LKIELENYSKIIALAAKLGYGQGHHVNRAAGPPPGPGNLN